MQRRHCLFDLLIDTCTLGSENILTGVIVEYKACLQDQTYLEQVSDVQYLVKQGFVPNMRVPGVFYVNDRLKHLIFEELENSYSRGGAGGFLPAVKQLANVAALPGIVQVSLNVMASRHLFVRA